ncbi:uncharacterized protein [Prorops nasuta]|uniref:uncharacterized protein n=1 Tax=Prorops nasuta TaxID=863751 RepID=UPI0034CF5C6B
MAPTVKRLISSQKIRETEVRNMLVSIQGKDRSTLTRNMIQNRINSVKDLWSEIRQTHIEISSRDDAEVREYMNENIFGQMQKIVEDAQDELVNLRDSLHDPSGSRSSSLCAGTQSDIVLQNNPSVAKLPKLDLPSFSGKYHDWDNFYDLFSSLVHNRPNLSDVAKLQYLKSCLVDSAAEFVQGVTVTEANYISTWKALKLRYCNPRLTVRTYLTELMQTTQLKKESSDGIRALIDRLQRILRSLSNLGLPIDQWSIWIIHIITNSLDPESQKLWEAEISIKDQRVVARARETNEEPAILDRFPTLKEFNDFLERRALSLNMIATNTATNKSSYSSEGTSSNVGSKTLGRTHKKAFAATTTPTTKAARNKCALCKGAHGIFNCQQFLKKDPYERRVEIRRLRLCYNCLNPHTCATCTSTKTCSICNGKHNTLLHFNKKQPSNLKSIEIVQDKDTKNNLEDSGITTVNTLTASIANSCRVVYLATAEIILYGPRGDSCRVRALIDQGSEASFISESIVQLLKLPRDKVEVSLSGLGSNPTGVSKSKVKVTLSSIYSLNHYVNLEALVIPRITTKLPSNRSARVDLKLFTGLQLADPHFTTPASADLLIGVEVFSQFLLEGVKHFPFGNMIAQNSKLGWIVSGSIEGTISGWAARKETKGPCVLTTQCTQIDELRASIEKFWGVEEIVAPSSRESPDNQYCEKLFRDSHKRDEEGRYEVRLPLKEGIPSVGLESRHLALQSLRNIHKRLNRDSRLAEAYKDFMKMYLELGHMERIPSSDIPNPTSWYLPHHPVVQFSNEHCKIRVVFDASRRVCNEHSLNQYLYQGPSLQSELPLILLQWREYRFVFTADIIKMFRQIRVHKLDQDYQRIVWADSSEEEPVDYRLTTVTYGTACAPYLAIRTLQQLAISERQAFPFGSNCLFNNCYVDDIFAGAYRLEDAIKIRKELCALLKLAGIDLDKWASNHLDLIPPSYKQNHVNKLISNDDAIKTLGILWSQQLDSFSFNVSHNANENNVITMRTIMSGIARLFDPLGWLAPVTVLSKILLQDLWILKCPLDDPLPHDMRNRWIKYCSSLGALTDLKIGRWLGITPSAQLELHGFCDASQRAYGAAVYLRVNDNNHIKVHLLIAKTKVSPIKTVSIPNLELNGAVLLVRLINYIKQLKIFNNASITAWCDSQVVLAWLRKHPCTWKVYVANRVSFVQTELPSAEWRHVGSKSNPADLASRGVSPPDLMGSKLWWNGPEWLLTHRSQWPYQPLQVHSVAIVHKTKENEFLTRFSTLTRLIRVLAYCLRPFRNRRLKKNQLAPNMSFLTASELLEARYCAIRMAQSAAFSKEMHILTKSPDSHSTLQNKALSRLYPFVSQSDGLLRVGGRLAYSNLMKDAKHPPILPKDSSLSKLYVKHAHHSTLHGGIVLTRARLLQDVWILGCNLLVRREVRLCIKCQRIRPKLAYQLMGNLPEDRVTRSCRPFEIAGVDYAGPIQLRIAKGRGTKSYKGYIALFVCFFTRAIHLEVVSDLTTEAFLAAYRRFTGRRGICRKMFSDNGTTFQGAARELKEMFSRSSTFYKEVAELLANDHTEWLFIPPHAPHCGGIWEAGIKSVKYHLHRVIGEHKLTYEELSTVLIDIEACLNTRPLCALTHSIDDLEVLTPAHFLIGGPLGNVPEGSLSNIPENRLSRFQLLQRMKEQFWSRWSTEYLHTLQERFKWKDSTKNLTKGQLVLLRDDRYPPSKWPLARVIELHPGYDNFVRVVTVKTATSQFRRHVNNLCPLNLPTADNQSIPCKSLK